MSPSSVSGERPLRIVIGADTFPPDINGAARFAHRLAFGLAGRGHDVHVICPSTTGPASTERVDGVTLHRLAARRTPFHPTFRFCPPWQARRGVERVLAQLNPDLIHIQAHFLVGRALARVGVDRGLPVVATNHFMPENLFGFVHMPDRLRTAASRWAWRDLISVYRDVRAVTAPTPRAVALLRDNGLRHQATAVSCGIDLSRYAAPTPVDPVPAAPVPAERATVLFVGRLDEEKRVPDLLGAVAMAHRQGRLAGRDLRVEIVGEGSRRASLEALATRLGIRDRVRFLGFVDEDELVAAYRRCDVFCMPGVAELQSLVTMEAMAAGKPVVAADAMALPHLVRPGRNGWLYPPGDVQALADRLVEILTDDQARARMGAASRDMIAAHDVNTTLATFEALYRRVLAAGEPVEAPAGEPVGEQAPEPVAERVPEPVAKQVIESAAGQVSGSAAGQVPGATPVSSAELDAA
ncbi:glycosyltransferase [Goodfellowiella coeruleoviolacea]|uniref:Glycosyltransferase involved in cell wall bisynthesis n=1 Tax=Goodfellowiella coeruleoviolacea TaxID=334858 RepID=A0AAE3GL90_9PSEU|nr:glycosyltransferase [Goodfellowiella coeruleoviolacea]MCP2170261.1 Glycosyltransferase involved in cell wall bisynthesis [Goodfellowiella coeruleoviolacea]